MAEDLAPQLNQITSHLDTLNAMEKIPDNLQTPKYRLCCCVTFCLTHIVPF